MKKFLIIVSALFFCSTGVVFAQSYSEERIEDFSTTFKINVDSTVDVTENITYNAGPFDRHGIYRDILLKNSFGKSVRLSKLSVTDINGNSYPYSTSNLGNSVFDIKIGDPDVTFTGAKNYIIKYRLTNALGFADPWDELYWNVLGDQWKIPIINVRVLVIFPTQLSNSPTYCYQGTGSNDECTIGHLYSLADLSVSANDYSVVQYTSTRIIKPGEFFTIVAGLPKNIIVEPGVFQKFFMMLNWTYLFLLLPLITLIIMLRQWYKYGRDPRSNRSIIAEYDVPDGLTPMEVSAILKEKVDGRSISAEIIYWATKGYLKIERTERRGLIVKTHSYTLNKIKAEDPEIPASKTLFQALFMVSPYESVKLEDLKNVFYQDMQRITKAVFRRMMDNGYLKNDPSTVKLKYTAFSLVIFFLIIFSLDFNFLFSYGLIPLLSLISSAVIIILVALFMPARTEKGLRTKEYILGLKEYLQIAEKDRINFHNAPEKKPEIFEKLLPFAMVLGVEKAWAKEFEDIYLQQPNWYSDPYSSGFNTMIFANSLHGFSSEANTSFTSAPGGGGGGFGGGGGGGSGGGGGGGGGGGW
jgi:uncharacterized membrane protein YgcG